MQRSASAASRSTTAALSSRARADGQGRIELTRGLLPATSEELCPTDALQTTLDTGRPDRCWSRFGVCSMVGNAAEWVDEHRVDITGQIVEEALDDQRTVRRQEFSLLRNCAFMGGSFLDPGRLMGMVFARTYADPAISRPPVGIRCATSLSGDEDPPTGMVALGPFEQARNGPPQLAYVEPLRGLGQEEAARVLGQTLELLLAIRRNASPNDFFLDLRPVSEQAYQDFVRRTRGRPGRWSHPRQPREKTSHAVGITQAAPEIERLAAKVRSIQINDPALAAD